MRDIWNPWHGCVRCSEGCQNCYMFFLDKIRHKNGADIYRTKNSFYYPLERDSKGNYKVKSGALIRVCMTSDFFLEEADQWREEAWNMMRQRQDVKFFLLTKRPQRVANCLPKDWGEGWENIFFNVTCENQKRADERIPLLLDLPFKHKGIVCAPLLGLIDIEPYLGSGQIEQVVCDGENYDDARPCDFFWVKTLRQACEKHEVTFVFMETGTHFIKDGRWYYHLPSKQLQSKQAYRSQMNYQGKPMVFKLFNFWDEPLAEEKLYQKSYSNTCQACASRLICNGCRHCGKCGLQTNSS